MASTQPPRKRTRRTENSSNELSGSKISSRRLFVPFRALGFVTNQVPFSVQTRSTKGTTAPPRVQILTCLGNSWAMWEGEKMTLLFVGTDLEKPITSLLMDGDIVWAASGCTVSKFLRGKQVERLENPLETTLSTISLFGSRMLALTADGSRLLVWDTSTLELVNTIAFDPGFTATQILHPATYLNKILVASGEGNLQLWNISTGLCIHKFDSSNLRHSTHTSATSAITAVVQSPAVDIVAIGFASGEVSVYDIRADERLLSVHMGAGVGSTGDPGRITSIGFRSDGEPILATATSTGHIAFWDLNSNARLLNVYRGAHEGAVTALEWIPGQPLLLSSGDDNSVKQWLFDSPTEPPRLLKFRGGHQTPPHLIRFYGNDGKQLLTASRDRSLRCTSVVRDSRSFELSQGSLAKKSASLAVPLSHFKFTPITSISFSPARSKDWEDILTSHSSSAAQQPTSGSNAASSYARTWSMQNKRLGRWTLGLGAPGLNAHGALRKLTIADGAEGPVSRSLKKAHTQQAGGVVRSVFVTACGNFGLAGSSNGQIAMWNMQSGIRRKTFDVGRFNSPLSSGSVPKKTTKPKGEGRAITGVAVDPLNRILVAATLDGTVNFFDFHTTKLEHVLKLASAAVSLYLQPDSLLLALICDDLTVRIVDLETRRLVREYAGFRGRILDIAFSPDSRWLIATSLDSIIRTFDIPTGQLVNAFKTASVATSVSFSPTGDFLATSHVDSVGVYLWANRAQYVEVSLQSFNEEEMLGLAVELPSVQGHADDEALGDLADLTLHGATHDVYTTPEQLGEELVTLTLLPRSRWQTFLNLETITQRNKPKEAPKVPEKAPFFLPTLPGVEHRFVVSGRDKESDVSGGATAKPPGKLDIVVESEFQRRLRADDSSGEYEDFFVYMKALSPAALDLEIRSLDGGPFPNATLSAFLLALTVRLRTHRDFEAVQAFLAVFLRLHGNIMVESEELTKYLRDLLSVQRAENDRVLELVASSLGTLSFVRDTI